METKNDKENEVLDTELLELFKEFYERQDIVQHQTTLPLIHKYGHSELHCIDAIGIKKDPNVSIIAQVLQITRGAACKIAKRLMARGDIRSYQRVGNKKEIYYELTAQGRKVYEAHKLRHNIWVERDLRFLKTVSREEKRVVLGFLRNFVRYLQEEIRQLDGQSESHCDQKGEKDGVIRSDGEAL